MRLISLSLPETIFLQPCDVKEVVQGALAALSHTILILYPSQAQLHIPPPVGPLKIGVTKHRAYSSLFSRHLETSIIPVFVCLFLAGERERQCKLNPWLDYTIQRYSKRSHDTSFRDKLGTKFKKLNCPLSAQGTELSILEKNASLEPIVP